MKVFVTGATGFIGTETVRELISAGHQVVGLVRTEEKGAQLTKAGAQFLVGSLDDHDVLAKGASESDAVIHLAFIHDFSDYAGSCAKDRVAIESMATALLGTGKPLVITSGTLSLPSGKLGTEDLEGNSNPRSLNEIFALGFAGIGVKVSVVRLPPTVHGDGDQGFVPMLIKKAKESGVSAYIGDGESHWSAVHKRDAARAYVAVIEKGKGGRYHVVDEEGVRIKEIASLIAKKLGLEAVSKAAGDEANAHFGFLGMFLGIDNLVSNKKTRGELGWEPKEVGLLEDMEKGTYFS